MNPRVEYEMTETDLETILAACKPVPYLVVGNREPSSPQENANMAWASLGTKMGFDSMTVRPSDKGQRFFSAVPSETEAQQVDRCAREANEKRIADIARVKTEIAEKTNELEALEC